MEYNFNIIGERIVKQRDKRHWSQDQLIDELEPYVPLARNKLSEMENGKAKRCDLIVLTAMCKVFGCEMSYLLGEIELPSKAAETVKSYTGLDDKAIERLGLAKQDHWWFVIQAMNELLQYDNFRLLDLIGQFLMMDEHETVELNDGERIDKGVLYSRTIEQELVKLRHQIQQKRGK